MFPEGEETYNTCKEDAYLTITRQFAAVSITPSIFCASEETKPGHTLSKKTIADINYLHSQIPEIKKYTVSLISWDSYTTKKYPISIYPVTRYVIYMKIKYIVKLCKRSYINQYMYSQKLILFLVAANDVRTSATKTLGESISDLLKQGL